MNNLGEYDGRKLISAESAGLDLATDGGRGSQDATMDTEKDSADNGDASVSVDMETDAPLLDEERIEDLVAWLKTSLDEKVSEVKVTSRLVTSPAVLVDHESAAIMRMMKMADQEHKSGNFPLNMATKQKMEINPAHPILRELDQARNKDPELAKDVVDQLFDNCLVAAGILEDPRSMVPRINKLLRGAMR